MQKQMTAVRCLYPLAALAMAVTGVVRTHPLPIAAQGVGGTRVLQSDNFADPATGILPQSSTNTTVQLGYVDGEYQIAVTDSSSPPQFVAIPGLYSDTTTQVDARVVGDPANQIVAVYCRRQDSPVSGYRFDVYPGSGTADLVKNDNNVLTLLQETIQSPAIHSGNESNHLDLTCTGDTILASVNGSQIAAVRDSSFQGGYSALVGGAVTERTSDARFGHLVVSEPQLPPSSTVSGALGPGAGERTSALPLDLRRTRRDTVSCR